MQVFYVKSVSYTHLDVYKRQVLEVKLQTQLGQEPPEWVRELVGSHLVEPVPKFSKFIHGVATLLNDKVDSIPFWLPQMDVDIRKPPLPSNINISRPAREDEEEDYDDDDEDDSALIDAMTHAPGNSLDLEEMVGYGAIDGVNQRANVPGEHNIPFSENYRYYQRKIRESGNSITKNYYKTIAFFDHYFNGDQISKIPRGTVFDTEIRAPPGKTICVPVRVEPKVYFATERTFLSWVSISILLGGVSTTMLTYGTPTTMLASIGFFVTALVVLFHAVRVYATRVVNIRMKKAVDYEDKVGPPMVCTFLLLSVLFSFFCNLP